MMAVAVAWLCVTLENIAITVCVTYAAVQFHKWSLLWFLVLVLLNGVTVRNNKQANNSDEEKKDSE